MICRIYRNGVRIYKGYHRTNGPIFVSVKITMWYQNDQLHREDGPAIEYSDGHKEWWINGRLHRKDGPAREWGDGTKEYWIDGEKYSELEWKEYYGM